MAFVEDLRFTIDRSQLRGLRTYTVGAAAVFVVLAGAWALSGRAGTVGVLTLTAGTAAIIGAYAWAAYAAAFTECTPAGLRTRGLFGAHQCTWPWITDIGVQPYGKTVTVMVTTASGPRFRLGAPVDGGVMRDPEFMSRTRQIIAYWRQMTTPAGVAEPAADWVSAGSQLGREDVAAAYPAGGQAVVALARRGPWYAFFSWLSRLLLTVVIPGLGVMALFFAVPAIVPAWSAHLGHGVPGIFTATTASRFQTCTQTCHPDVNWYGTFTARDGSVITGVRLAEGGHISGLGGREAALYEGGGVAYPAGGGPDWLYLTLMLIAGIAAIAFWIALLARMLIRRHRRLASTRASLFSYSRQWSRRT